MPVTDGVCPDSVGEVTLRAARRPSPDTHFAIVSCAGSREASLVPFPSKETPDARGKLVEVLRKAHSESSADEGTYLVITPPEPLCPAVFSFLCRKMEPFTIDHRTSLWTLTREITLNGCTSGITIAQVCQLFRMAAFLQWEFLLDLCRSALNAWCVDMLVMHDSNPYHFELMLEGVARKSWDLVRSTHRAGSADQTRPDILSKIEEWKLPDFVNTLPNELKPVRQGNTWKPLNDDVINKALLLCLPNVLVPSAELQPPERPRAQC